MRSWLNIDEMADRVGLAVRHLRRVLKAVGLTKTTMFIEEDVQRVKTHLEEQRQPGVLSRKMREGRARNRRVTRPNR